MCCRHIWNRCKNTTKKNTIGKFVNRYYSLLYFFNKVPSYKEFVALIGYLAFIYLTSISTFAIFAISYWWYHLAINKGHGYRLERVPYQNIIVGVRSSLVSHVIVHLFKGVELTTIEVNGCFRLANILGGCCFPGSCSFPVGMGYHLCFITHNTFYLHLLQSSADDVDATVYINSRTTQVFHSYNVFKFTLHKVLTKIRSLLLFDWIYHTIT